MNSNRVNGTIDEVVGSAKQKAGKLIGNPSLQVEGAVQQVKGKLVNTVGKVQDAVDKANLQANPPRKTRS
ncbi:MAG: CsbD family protein [Terracidiphilus sp.]